jgi:hypothetical protein
MLQVSRVSRSFGYTDKKKIKATFTKTAIIKNKKFKNVIIKKLRGSKISGFKTYRNQKLQ